MTNLVSLAEILAEFGAHAGIRFVRRMSENEVHFQSLILAFMPRAFYGDPED